MIKFWLENPNEVEDAVEYVWLDGIVTNIYSPYQFEFKEKTVTFYCDYTKTINPVEPLELNIGERYSVQGHLTGEKVNGVRELWVCGKPVPHSVIEERRKERMRVEEEVKQEIKEKIGVPKEYQLEMEVIE